MFFTCTKVSFNHEVVKIHLLQVYSDKSNFLIFSTFGHEVPTDVLYNCYDFFLEKFLNYLFV